METILQLRAFTTEDASEIVSWFATKRDALSWGGRMFGWPIASQKLIARAQEAGLDFYVLQDQHNDLLGFIELRHMDDAEIRFCRVAVSPKHRGKGLGRQLVLLALEKARAKGGYREVSLAVFNDNLAAHRCYEGIGFYETDKQPRMKVFDGEEWPLVQMEYRL